eukprot:jgi/Picsp_1/4796/NSC_02164-R1_snf1-related protein kinase regulatory subunit beta-2
MVQLIGQIDVTDLYLWTDEMGQAHGKVGRDGGVADSQAHGGNNILVSQSSGSPNIPGSPVTYSPQLPMEPMTMVDGDGWVGEPKSVPTVFVWSHGGNHVELEGSFDSWSTRHVMQKTGRDFSLVKLLPPGVYQYKFIVDGQWRHDPNLTSMYDDQGNINNVVEVQEYIAENLDGLANFDPPPSPVLSYCNPTPVAEDFLKEPPMVPPQLQLSLLNVPPAMESSAALPRPQHVVLNHMYLQRGSQSRSAIVVGTTNRFRSKYVTTVLYRAKQSEYEGIKVVGPEREGDTSMELTSMVQ